MSHRCRANAAHVSAGCRGHVVCVKAGGGEPTSIAWPCGEKSDANGEKRTVDGEMREGGEEGLQLEATACRPRRPLCRERGGGGKGERPYQGGGEQGGG